MYTITRDELVLMIQKETNTGFKRILNNHLRKMDGLSSQCIPCELDEPVEAVQEVLEPIEEPEEE